MPHDRKSRKIGVFMRRNARIGEKNRSTLDVLFKKTLTFDIARQQRSNLALFDNDAACCYDGILVNLAMLCSRRFGVPKEAILAHSETLGLVKYTIKTVYGTSQGFIEVQIKNS